MDIFLENENTATANLSETEIETLKELLTKLCDTMQSQAKEKKV